MTGPDDGGRPVLGSGQFYSEVVRQERVDDLFLAELSQPGDRRVPQHEHELGYVTLVVEGHYEEATELGPTELPAFTAIFNPSGVAHTGRVGGRGTRLFTIECGSRGLARLDLRLPSHPVADAGAGTMLWPGAALYSAWKSRTAEPLLIESYAVEMFGALARWEPVGSVAPPWFARVRDRLHAEFRDRLTIRDLATEAGVHPVHLARVFRAQERQTPGEYLQRLRVRAACDRLGEGEGSLAAVAADCGFYDQSHFNRVFRRIVGSTPGALRRALRRG